MSLWKLFLVLLILAGCAAPPAVTVKPFADNRAWLLQEDMVYEVGSSGKTIVVPAGFVTDYASVPQVLWGVLSPHDQYSRAAVVHDFLYWAQVCTRSQSDNILKIAMIESDVPTWKQTAVHEAVLKFGQSSWDENTRLKQQGYVRIVSGAPRRAAPNETWEAYRGSLYQAGVREKPVSVDADVCALGNQAEVPGRTD
jgi:Protein of unknown function (DUF1353)